MSTTTEPFSEGTPMAKGLVPKMASVAPCGVTYSGDWESTMPIMPLSASCFAQYLRSIPVDSVTAPVDSVTALEGSALSARNTLQIHSVMQHWLTSTGCMTSWCKDYVHIAGCVVQCRNYMHMVACCDCNDDAPAHPIAPLPVAVWLVPTTPQPLCVAFCRASCRAFFITIMPAEWLPFTIAEMSVCSCTSGASSSDSLSRPPVTTLTMLLLLLRNCAYSSTCKAGTMTSIGRRPALDTLNRHNYSLLKSSNSADRHNLAFSKRLDTAVVALVWQLPYWHCPAEGRSEQQFVLRVLPR